MVTSSIKSDTRFSAAARAQSPAGTLPPAASGAAASIQGSIWIIVFLLSVVQPFSFMLGETTLGPYRLFLFLAATPVFAALAQGRAGRIILPDILVIAYSFWMFFAIFVIDGMQMKAPFMVAQIVETMVPYFLARVLIRNAANFRFFIRWWMIVGLLLLPFAFVELLTNQKLLLQLYAGVPGGVVFKSVIYPQRLGLNRVQGPFEHPILFGVFYAMAFAMAWRALPPADASPLRRSYWTVVCVIGTFCSVSSGALSAVMLQIVLLGWDIVLRNVKTRWRLFALGFAGLYLVLSLVVESSPLLYLISHITFSSGTAWNRVLIWEYGSAAVMQHPIFGNGFHDWNRPDWVGASVDNYWLLITMRYGLVGLGLHAATFLLVFWKAARANLGSEPPIAGLCRSAYLISLAGVSTAIATVFIWSASYSMFMFLLGSGVWIFTQPPRTASVATGMPDAPVPAAEAGRRRGGPPRYTRFSRTGPSPSGS